MKSPPIIKVVIPAFNEENGVGQVIAEIPKHLVHGIIVVINASTDNTEKIAKAAGATVLREPTPGYGRACLKGIAYLNKSVPPCDIVVFLDADHSDYPEEMAQLVNPILVNDVDLVIGSRSLGQKESGSMTPQQLFGNWLATQLLKWLYDVKFSDLGPFRAVRYSSLLKLNMLATT